MDIDFLYLEATGTCLAAVLRQGGSAPDAAAMAGDGVFVRSADGVARFVIDDGLAVHTAEVEGELGQAVLAPLEWAVVDGEPVRLLVQLDVDFDAAPTPASLDFTTVVGEPTPLFVQYAGGGLSAPLSEPASDWSVGDVALPGGIPMPALVHAFVALAGFRPALLKPAP